MSESATLCRFMAPHQTEPRVGLVHAGEIRDLWPAGVRRLDALLEDADLADRLARLRGVTLPAWPLDQVRLLTPVESQEFPSGAVLLTGAGIVPDDAFTLNAGDTVRITISGIGTLENPVVV